MTLLQIDLRRLLPHPAAANALAAPLRAKLRTHIARTGRYEPLVVRPHPTAPGTYQLLNGCQRRAVLAELGYRRAWCVVWSVDDEEALVLLATLNRLAGRDNPRRRAALAAQLRQQRDEKELTGLLPETPAQLGKLLAARRPPQPVDPAAARPPFAALTFFVTEAQKALVERALRNLRRESEPGALPRRRGDLLALMAGKISDEGGGENVDETAT